MHLYCDDESKSFLDDLGGVTTLRAREERGEEDDISRVDSFWLLHLLGCGATYAKRQMGGGGGVGSMCPGFRSSVAMVQCSSL